MAILAGIKAKTPPAHVAQVLDGDPIRGSVEAQAQMLVDSRSQRQGGGPCGASRQVAPPDDLQSASRQVGVVAQRRVAQIAGKLVQSRPRQGRPYLNY